MADSLRYIMESIEKMMEPDPNRWIKIKHSTTAYISGFVFKEKTYYHGTIVRFTDEAQKFLGAIKKEAVFVSSFKWKEYVMYRYEYRDSWYGDPVKMAVNVPPDDFLECVVEETSKTYEERKQLGQNAPSYYDGERKVDQTHLQPMLAKSSIALGVVTVLSFFLKGGATAIWLLGTVVVCFCYNTFATMSCTYYEHKEDIEAEKKRRDVLYK